jgi:hypothetical protein
MVVKEKPKMKAKVKAKENEADVSVNREDSVQKRVNEWERERERLREMERLEAFGRERDEELECARMASEQDLSFTTCSRLSLPEQEQSIQTAKVAVRASAQVVNATPSFFGMLRYEGLRLPL